MKAPANTSKIVRPEAFAGTPVREQENISSNHGRVNVVILPVIRIERWRDDDELAALPGPKRRRRRRR